MSLATNRQKVTKMSEELTNGKVMEILESIAKEWAIDKSDEQIETVADYMNTVCAKWMGGNWGLKLKHIKNLPEKLYRKDDNEVFVLIPEKQLYVMERSMMHNPYEYTYGRLMETGTFRDKPTEGNKK